MRLKVRNGSFLLAMILTAYSGPPYLAADLHRLCNLLARAPSGLQPLCNQVEAQIRAEGEVALVDFQGDAATAVCYCCNPVNTRPVLTPSEGPESLLGRNSKGLQGKQGTHSASLQFPSELRRQLGQGTCPSVPSFN